MFDCTAIRDDCRGEELRLARECGMQGVTCMKHLLVVALLLSGLAFADDVDAAQKAYQAKQWKDAVTMYGRLTQAEPKNPLYWYRLGTSLRMSGDLPKAEAALTQAQQLGFQPMMISL